MKNFWKKNKIAVLVALILFIIPFFWFKPGEVNYGGDSTRLYFYNPSVWRDNIALYFINPLIGLGEGLPNFSQVPFLIFLVFLKKLLGSPFLLNNVFNGLLLGGGFFLVYLISRELAEDNGQKSFLFPEIIAGLFFSLSPILIYDWERPLSSINQIFVYPAIFWLWLKYIKTKKHFFLGATIPIFYLFSLNFAFPTAPWWTAFFFFAFIFFLCYSVLQRKLAVFLKGTLVLLGIFILTTSFNFMPQVADIVSSSGSAHQMIFNKESSGNQGLPYFLSVCFRVRLTYNLLSQSQYIPLKDFIVPAGDLVFNFGIKFLPLFFAYPLAVILGLLLVKEKKRKNLMVLLFSLFLILLFLMTANLTGLGLRLYKSFFSLPGFSMFRSFYSKFSFPFIFFYALLLSLALTEIWSKIGRNARRLTAILFLFLTIFSGWPFISGRIVNGSLWQSEGVKIPTQIDPQYEKFIEGVTGVKPNLKILSLPLLAESYQLLRGKNDGAYFGPSTLPILTGKNAFSGTTGFSVFWPEIKKLIEEEHLSELKKYLNLLNIGYVFYNSDNYLFEKFPLNPYSEWLKNIFPDQKAVGRFASGLAKQKLVSEDPYTFLKIDDPLPHFYVSREDVYVAGGVDLLTAGLSLSGNESRLAYFLENPQAKFLAGSFFSIAEDKDMEKLLALSVNIEEEVFYPYVKRKSPLRQKLSFIKERWDKLRAVGLEELIKKRIFYANKRINEAVTFSEETIGAYGDYSKEIKSAVLSLSDIEVYKDRVRLALWLRKNLKDNFSKINSSNLKNSADWEKIINEYLAQVENVLPQFRPDQRNYSIKIPKEGKYSLLFQGQTDAKTEQVVSELSRAVIEINGQKIERSGSEVFLKEGETCLVLKNLGQKNLLSGIWEKGWEGKTAYLFQEISGWLPENWYYLKGTAQDKNIKIAIVEKYKGQIEGLGRWGYEDKFRVIKEIKPDEKSGSFELYFKSLERAQQGSVRIYRDSGELTEGKQNFLNIKVIPLIEPEVVVKNSQNLSNQEIPQITFSKINPTKYRILVEGASGPYSLVFSEYFHTGWKLYLSQSRNYPQSISASYFDGEIRETDHKNIFLDKNTFETWGRKPVAEKGHFLVNGYANLWYITPEDTGGAENYELIVEFWPQRLFYLGIAGGTLVFSVSLFYLAYALIKTKNE